MVRIVIEVDQRTGQIQVEGPIGDKILMCGVLEMVKRVVLDQKASPILVSPETHLRVVADTPTNNHKEP